MDALLGLQHVGDQVAVRQHHAFRQTGRPARIGESDHVFRGIDLYREGLGRLGDQFAKGRRARRLSEDEDLVDRETTHGLGRPVHERGHGQEIACMAIPELVTQLARGVEGIEGCDDAAERRDGVEGDRVLGQVRTEDGEDVTLLEPSASQRAGDPVHAVGQGAVGQLPAADAIDESRPVTNGRRPLQRKPRQRNIRDLERRTLVDHLASIWSLKDVDQAFVAPPKLHKMSVDGSRALSGSGWSRT